MGVKNDVFKQMKCMMLVVGGLVMLVGCNQEAKEQAYVPESIVGYIYIENNQVVVDEVEIITREDKDRIKELGLSEADYPSGYYIYNEVVEEEVLELTEDTEYTFADVQELYKKNKDGDNLYRTNDLEEFLKGSSYPDISLEKQTIPYFIEFYDGKMISVTEDIIYTF